MQQTLFLVPQSWLEGPLLIAWLVLGVVIMAALALRKGQPADAFSFLPIYIENKNQKPISLITKSKTDQPFIISFD